MFQDQTKEFYSLYLKMAANFHIYVSIVWYSQCPYISETEEHKIFQNQ